MFPAAFKSRLLLWPVTVALLLPVVQARHSDHDLDAARRCRSHRLFGKAWLSMKRRQWRDAEANLQEAVQLTPEEPSLYRGLARCYLAMDRLPTAAEAAATAARLDGSNYANWLLL